MNFDYIDLFCGVGGFRYAMEAALSAVSATGNCRLSSDIDKNCQRVYAQNFGETPVGDITKVAPSSLADFDVLLAGFPCQPFSIMGQMKGFADMRGTLFFNIAEILAAKKPRAFVLENVKLLKGHNQGKTLARIMEVLRELGYYADYRIYNALDFGLPQKRERIFIVGFREPAVFKWPVGKKDPPQLSHVLEKDVDSFYQVSPRIYEKRKQQVASLNGNYPRPGIWHENKAGHVSVYPYSCALRAGSSYNYLLVDGERRLTGREMFRLQGFPDSCVVDPSYTTARHQAGNSLPVPVATAVITNVLKMLSKSQSAQAQSNYYSIDGQLCFFETEDQYDINQ